MDHAIGTEQNRMLDAVLQLSDVSGPVIGQHGADGGRADADDAFVHPPGVFVGEVIGEQQNIISPLAQCGESDGENIDAVVQIVPELPVAQCFFQIAIGGTNDSDIRMDRRVATDAFELALL